MPRQIFCATAEGTEVKLQPILGLLHKVRSLSYYYLNSQTLVDVGWFEFAKEWLTQFTAQEFTVWTISYAIFFKIARLLSARSLPIIVNPNSVWVPGIQPQLQGYHLAPCTPSRSPVHRFFALFLRNPSFIWNPSFNAIGFSLFGFLASLS